MPVPPAPQPSGVRLFIEGMRFDALAYSSAGVTVPRSVLNLQQELRRGTPCPATLQIFGEMYGVVLRLAAAGEDHAEFAFVSLAPQARRALEHYAAEPKGEARSLGLAFSQMLNAAVPAGRQLVLPESERLYALTVARRGAERRKPEPSPPALALPSSPDLITVSGRALLVWATGLLGLLTLSLWALI